MPIVKTQGGKVVTKDGKVSCECCAPPVSDCTTATTSPSFSEIELWTLISEEQYAELFAGGSWLISVSASLTFSATIDDQDGIDPYGGSSIGSATGTAQDVGGCYTSQGYGEGIGTATSEWLIGSTTYNLVGTVTRRLGTNNGQRFVSFAGSGVRALNPLHKITRATVGLPASRSYFGSIPTQSQLDQGIVYTASMNFGYVAHGTNESQITIQTQGGAYPYSYVNNPSQGNNSVYDISETGSFGLSAIFIPSAP